MAIAVVLIVDDEPSIVALLTEVLEDEGYKVVGACNGREAFTLAIETLPDVVLTDINMPHMSGIQLSGMLHTDTKTSRMPVILMSATPPPLPRDAGVAAFIGKPFDVARVVQLIAQHIPA